MSRRAEAIRWLAQLLSDEAGVAVEADWTGSGSRWVISWTDGPTVQAMRSRAVALIEQLRLGEPAMRPGRTRRIDPAALEWFRSVGMHTVAMVLLDRYRDGLLPEDRSRWSIEAAHVEEVLRGTVPYPECRNSEALAAGRRLAELAGGYPHRMGELLAANAPAALGIEESAAAKPDDAGAGDLRGRWVWGAWPERGVTIIERRLRPGNEITARTSAEPGR